MSPNAACNCLLHMNLSIVQLLCLYMHVYLFVSISCSDFLSVISVFIYKYMYVYIHLYLFIQISLHMYFIYAHICKLFSLSLWHVSSARSPPQFFSPLFQFHFTLPQFHFTAAKKALETCACFLLPCFQVQLIYFHIHMTLSFRSHPPGLQVIRHSVASGAKTSSCCCAWPVTAP